MFKKLQQRWKVNWQNLLLIIIVFAVGGSLCGWLGRKLLLAINIDKGIGWILLYLVFITILWPFCVILISIPLGQFRFFRGYLLKIRQKMTGEKSVKPNKTFKVAMFASGAGSNALRIIQYFSGKENPVLKPCLLVCNNPAAGVMNIASDHDMPTLVIHKDRFQNGDGYLPILKEHGIEFIVLAGFLWKIPGAIIDAFPLAIINIHPALLPKYGGKGMYGHHVHEAVIANQEKESGISIHFVDEMYDHGSVIFQARCSLTGADTVETLTQKIRQLEHLHYPGIIEETLKSKIEVKQHN